jgi:hypothetical protein
MLAENTDPVELGGNLIVDGLEISVAGSANVDQTFIANGGAPIDLVNGAGPTNYQIIAPRPRRILRINQSWYLVTVGGTRSVLPTYTIGTNAPNFDNVYASSTGAGNLLTGVAFQYVSVGTLASPIIAADLTTSGLVLRLSAGITGVAPVCTARLWFNCSFGPV